MKKSLLAIVIAASGVAATAQANWYVEGDLGYSKIKTSGLHYGEINKSKFTPSVIVGYKFVDWRLAADYTHYGKSEYSYGGVGNGELKIHSFGFSAIYDLNLNTDLKPYIGVRLASNLVKVDEFYRAGNGNVYSYSEDSTRFGYGAFAGAAYQLAPNWALTGTVEYNRLGKVNDVKINQYGAKVGLRYTF
ncbi:MULTISPECIES: opacity family porin [Pasteurellaceae]|uniref:opacity family porin n=1 Tax=Pasteurellaceae TaxID=712 RepID=UPI000509E8C3